MTICPNCGFEQESGKFCIKCGQSLQNTGFQNNFRSNLNDDNRVADNDSSVVHQNNIPQGQDYSLQQQNNIPPQQNSSYQDTNYQQYNDYNQQYNNQNRPQNQKSKAVGLILNFLVVGLGYAYVGKWGEGIVLFVVYFLMWILGFALIFPFLIALIIWIYSLFKTNEMIDKYNRGELY